MEPMGGFEGARLRTAQSSTRGMVWNQEMQHRKAGVAQLLPIASPDYQPPSPGGVWRRLYDGEAVKDQMVT